MANSSSQTLLLLFLLAISCFDYSSAAWCVCKDGLSDTVLQRTLDYACGAGADCSPIRASGPCYSPPSVKAHCSYAVNSYFQKRSQASGTCDFGGTAAVTSSNPSTNGCSFPASATSSGGGSASVGTTPTTSPVSGTTTPVTGSSPTTPVIGSSPKVSGSGTPTTSSSPYTTTVQPTTSGSSSYPTGLTGTSIAPTGVSMNDNRGGVLSPQSAALCWVFVATLVVLHSY